ncbi:MAG: helix-turn-helix domain-containing protein [Chlamydiales bacterium]|jgi:transposase|nr:helix-turn-helix domain-containing protein [Chlamydiales bacterium]
MQPKANLLTRNQKDILKARHRDERDKRLCDRIKTILLLDEGWTYSQVAYALLLDEETIRRYYKTYSEGGKEALLHLNYTGKACRLNQDQYVKEETPTSAQQTIHFVQTHFRASYIPSATISLLRQLNFTYKKPKLIPGKVNEEVKKTLFPRMTKARKRTLSNRSRVEIKFLPPHSPNVHLIERLWRFMNKKMRNHRYDEKFSDFKSAIYPFFENFPKCREELQPLFSWKFSFGKS